LSKTTLLDNAAKITENTIETTILKHYCSLLSTVEQILLVLEKSALLNGEQA